MADDPGQGMPNRVVFLAPAGTGAQVAQQIRAGVDEAWQRRVRQGLAVTAQLSSVGRLDGD